MGMALRSSQVPFSIQRPGSSKKVCDKVKVPVLTFVSLANNYGKVFDRRDFTAARIELARALFTANPKTETPKYNQNYPDRPVPAY